MKDHRVPTVCLATGINLKVSGRAVEINKFYLLLHICFAFILGLLHPTTYILLSYVFFIISQYRGYVSIFDGRVLNRVCGVICEHLYIHIHSSLSIADYFILTRGKTSFPALNHFLLGLRCRFEIFVHLISLLFWMHSLHLYYILSHMYFSRYREK